MKKFLRYLLLLSITMFCVMYKPDNAYAYGGSGNHNDYYKNNDEIYEDHRDETGQSGSSNNKNF